MQRRFFILVTGLVAGMISTAQAAIPDCKQVCGDVRTKLKHDSKDVKNEYERWKERLSLKSDTVTYLRGYSAAEELLKYMSTYYETKAPENQMDPQFLSYLMGKCFPETFVDVDRAKLSGLVDTIYAAKNLPLEKKLNSCK